MNKFTINIKILNKIIFMIKSIIFFKCVVIYFFLNKFSNFKHVCLLYLKLNKKIKNLNHYMKAN